MATKTPITSDVGVLSDKKILQYPMGLGSTALDAYGLEQHYMLFKINTDVKTTALRDDKVTGSVMLAENTRQGIGVGASPRGMFQKNDDKDLRKLHGDAAVDKQKFVVQKGMTRLDKVIVLPMPMEHSVSTSIKYNDDFASTELTKLGDMMNNGGGAMLSDVWSKLKNEGMAGIVNTIKSGSTTTQAMEAEDRLGKNPKKEVMFDSFGFRSFTFSFQFAPKSLEESDMVRDIIETFRYYSLPEITAGKMYYIFPAEFEISFMLGQNINPYIPKISTCVVKRVATNYIPNSIWASLPNGAPLALSMTIDVTELELIDRTRVYNATQPIISGY